jgi:hypothetical protein
MLTELEELLDRDELLDLDELEQDEMELELEQELLEQLDDEVGLTPLNSNSGTDFEAPSLNPVTEAYRLSPACGFLKSSSPSALTCCVIPPRGSCSPMEYLLSGRVLAAVAFSPGRRMVASHASYTRYQDNDEDEDGDEESLPELEEPSCA